MASCGMRVGVGVAAIGVAVFIGCKVGVVVTVGRRISGEGVGITGFGIVGLGRVDE